MDTEKKDRQAGRQRGHNNMNPVETDRHTDRTETETERE